MKSKIVLSLLAIIYTSVLFAQHEGNDFFTLKDGDVTFCQIPSTFNNFNTSSVETGQIVVQHLNVQSIYSILFYGAKFSLEESTACASDELKFMFKIFEDNSGEAGNEIVSLRDSAVLLATATNFNIGTVDVVYHWEYVNTNLTNLPESYFLGIQSSSSECRFLWASGPENIEDDRSYKFNPETEMWEELNIGQTVCIESPLTNEIFINEGRKTELFPNPTQSSLTLKTDQIYTIEIVNANGKVLSSFQMESQEQKIDVSQFEKGIYFIRFWENNDTFVKKILIY